MKQPKNKKIILFPRERKRRKRKQIGMILIFVLIFSFGIGKSFAKYVTTIKGKIEGEIAEPIIELQGKETLTINSNEESQYYFEIKNYKEDQKINEVIADYWIEIIPHTEERITYQLWKGETQIPLNENKTEKMKLNSKEKQTDQYRLKVQKKGEDEEAEGTIEIKLLSVQKEGETQE